MNAGCSELESRVWSPGRRHRFDLSELLLWQLNKRSATLVL
jgi:hypothetical protein